MKTSAQSTKSLNRINLKSILRGACAPFFFSMKTFIIILFILIGGLGFSQGTLQFNQIKLVSANIDSVPANKIWKIENAYIGQVNRFQASSGSGGGCSSCNGSSTNWTSFQILPCPASSDFQSKAQMKINGAPIWYNSGSPIWLPSGSTLQGMDYNCNSSAGGFTGQGYSCFCPPPTTVYSTITVIEFNVIP